MPVADDVLEHAADSAMEGVNPRPMHELVPALIAVLERIREQVQGGWVGLADDEEDALVAEATVLWREARAELIGYGPTARENRDLVDAWWSVGADAEEQRIESIRETLANLVVRNGYRDRIPVRRALFAAYVELFVFTCCDDGPDLVAWGVALEGLEEARALLAPSATHPAAAEHPEEPSDPALWGFEAQQHTVGGVHG